MKARWIITGFAIAVVISLGGFLSPTVKAQARPANRYEQAALDWYHSDGQCVLYGALWLTKDSDDNPFGGDEVGVVDVAHDASSVFVRMRGSSWNCPNAAAGSGYNVYASNIRRGKGDNSHRLFLENGKPLYDSKKEGFGLRFNRGPAAKSGWSDPKYASRYVRLKVDIRGFAAPGESKVMNVSIFRCFSMSDSNVIESENNCRSETYQLTVRRAKKPVPPVPQLKPWQIEGRSYIRKTGSSQWGDPSRKISAKVGEQIDFRHTLVNRGYAGNNNVSWSVNSNQIFGASSLEVQKGVTSRRPVLGSGLFVDSSFNPTGGGKSDHMRYTIKSSDVGKTLCQSISFSPNSGDTAPPINDAWQYSSGASSSSRQACVYVAADYEFIPIVPVGGGGSGASSECKYSCDKEVEAGGSGKIPPAIISIPKTKIFDTEWKLTSFVVKPDSTVPTKEQKGVKTSQSNPCSTDIFGDLSKIYSSSEKSHELKIDGCKVEQSGVISSADFLNNPNADRGSFEISLQDRLKEFVTPESAAVGTKYCFALSVSPYKMSGEWTEDQQKNFRDWYHGEPGCIVIVKKPKVQVLGGGLYAEGSILSHKNSDLSTRSGRIYGSWVEYEAFAVNGQNRNVATNGVWSVPNSVGGFAGGINDLAVRNRLSFANVFSDLGRTPTSEPTAGKFGLSTFSSERFFSQIENAFRSEKMTETSDFSGDFSDGERMIIKPRSSEINLGNLNIRNKTIVIFAPEKTVKILGNIIATKISQNDLAQVIVLAKDIEIDAQVTKIDAWLLAKNSLNTCSYNNGRKTTTNSLRDGVCAQTLEMNGPVVVGGKNESLKLWRTAGSTGAGDLIGSPAEIFNLNPDTYQWLKSQAENSDKIITTHVKELPVRF